MNSTCDFAHSKKNYRFDFYKIDLKIKIMKGRVNEPSKFVELNKLKLGNCVLIIKS